MSLNDNPVIPISVTITNLVPPPGVSTISLSYGGPGAAPAWLTVADKTIDVNTTVEGAPTGGVTFQYTCVTAGYEVTGVDITDDDGGDLTDVSSGGNVQIADSEVQQTGTNSGTYNINIGPIGGGTPLVVDPVIRNDY